MDISQTGQMLLTYLYNSIFTEYELWDVKDPGINGIDLERWGKEKGIETAEIIRGMEELENLELFRTLSTGSFDATLTPKGIQRVEASGWANAAVIARQKAARRDMLHILAKTPHEGLRPGDVLRGAGVSDFELDANSWYLEKLGFVRWDNLSLAITAQGYAEARSNPSAR